MAAKTGPRSLPPLLESGFERESAVCYTRSRGEAPRAVGVTGTGINDNFHPGGDSECRRPLTSRSTLPPRKPCDIVIGMSDGLTVPFALAAGLSGAVDSTALIITAGLAEVAAGAIAMGLGGYRARTDAEHFATERAREERETQEIPEAEAAEVAQVFRSYGLPEDTVTAVVARSVDRKRWVDFMTKLTGHGRAGPPPGPEQRPDHCPVRMWPGALSPGSLFLPAVDSCGLFRSVIVTLLALFCSASSRDGSPPIVRCAVPGKPSLVADWRHPAAFAIAKLIG